MGTMSGTRYPWSWLAVILTTTCDQIRYAATLAARGSRHAFGFSAARAEDLADRGSAGLLWPRTRPA